MRGTGGEIRRNNAIFGGGLRGPTGQKRYAALVFETGYGVAEHPGIANESESLPVEGRGVNKIIEETELVTAGA